MNALEISNLSKKYDGFYLDHLDLTLPQGCVLGLVGENGAGKSTTIKLILDMIHRDSGSITVLGKDNQKHLQSLKQDLGVVLDEVGIPACLTAKQVGKIMGHTFDRWNDAVYASYLQKFSLPTDKPFKELSRGMKMKLGLAVALSHDPKMLLLDEATSGLDPVIRDEVIDIFSEFTREESHSILISSHIVSDLEKICDYIAFLHKGKLLLCEEKDRLTEQYGILQCSQAELMQVNEKAIIGKKLSPYGAQALVRRDRIGPGWSVRQVSIEEIFIFMVKENG